MILQTSQNMYLASRDAGTSGSSTIIPSFHRAALINYIVNWKDPATYTEAEFRATLKRIELAVGRPLSINSVSTPSIGYLRISSDLHGKQFRQRNRRTLNGLESHHSISRSVLHGMPIGQELYQRLFRG